MRCSYCAKSSPANRTTGDVKTAAECAVTQIDAALHPEWLAVLGCALIRDDVRSASGEVTAGPWARYSWVDGGVAGASQAARHVLTVPVHGFSSASASENSNSSIAPRSVSIVPASLDPAGVELIFVLGAKRSGEPYSREDKNLVQAVAESVGHLATTMSLDTT